MKVGSSLIYASGQCQFFDDQAADAGRPLERSERRVRGRRYQTKQKPGRRTERLLATPRFPASQDPRSERSTTGRGSGSAILVVQAPIVGEVFDVPDASGLYGSLCGRRQIRL